MISVLLYGRLGNNLFQIATALCLANKVNEKCCIVIDRKTCDLYKFLNQFYSNVLRNVFHLITDIEKLDNFERVKEQCYFYLDFDLSLIKGKNILLDGYWQSYKYFDENYIKEVFQPSDAIIEEIKSKYPIQGNLTAINVRRGDYLKYMDVYPLCLGNYFNKAAKLIVNETDKFICCSDDIEWCKKQFGERYLGKDIIYIESQPIYIQFYIMTLCHNIIISNSTFSWWAAYLNIHTNKKVFYPKHWYYSYDKKKLSTQDLIPKDWIAVNNVLEINYYARFINCFWKHRIWYQLKRVVKHVIKRD